MQTPLVFYVKFIFKLKGKYGNIALLFHPIDCHYGLTSVLVATKVQKTAINKSSKNQKCLKES
ncbi:hypothetical protein BLOT_003645 [Blomia tropicalis]|nr:hypothetical protein BLOT_003645 [Blomia tropicalis]